MGSAVKVLWTKQLTKKQKTWNDGFVLLKPSGAAILLDENGKELSSSRLPKHVEDIATYDEHIKCWEGYLVQSDGPCSVSDIPGRKDSSSAQDSTNSSATVQRWHTAPQQSYTAHQQQTRPPIVPQVVRRRRSITVSNQVALPAALSTAAEWPVQRQCCQQQTVADAVAVLQPSPALNSDMDILQMLDSIGAPTAEDAPSYSNDSRVAWGQQQQPTDGSHQLWMPNGAPCLEPTQRHQPPQQFTSHQRSEEQHQRQPQQQQQQHAVLQPQQQQQQQQPQKPRPFAGRSPAGTHVKSSASIWGCARNKQGHNATAPAWQQQQQQRGWRPDAVAGDHEAGMGPRQKEAQHQQSYCFCPAGHAAPATAQQADADDVLFDLDLLENEAQPQQPHKKRCLWQQNQQQSEPRLAEAETATEGLLAALEPEQPQPQQQMLHQMNKQCDWQQAVPQQQQLKHAEQQHIRTEAGLAATNTDIDVGSSLGVQQQQQEVKAQALQALHGAPIQQQQQQPSQQQGRQKDSISQLNRSLAAASRWSRPLQPRHSAQQQSEQQQPEQQQPAQQQQQQQHDLSMQPDGVHMPDRKCQISAHSSSAAMHKSNPSNSVRSNWQTPVSNNANSISWQTNRQPLHQLHDNQQHNSGPLQQKWQQKQADSPHASVYDATGTGPGFKPAQTTKRQSNFITPGAAQQSAAAAVQQQQHPGGHMGAVVSAARQQQQQQQLMYRFPPAGSPVLLRYAAIPTSFSSVVEYKAALLAALAEEVNLKLAEHAKAFHSLARQMLDQQQQQSGTVHPGLQQQQRWKQASGKALQVASKPGKQQQQHGSLAQLQSLCSRNGIQYHPNSTLTVYQRSSNASKFGGYGSKGKGKGGKWGKKVREVDCDDVDQEDAETPVKLVSIFLTLGGAKLDRRKFRKHDLWVLSNQPLITTATADADAAGPRDRCSLAWIYIARSLWHAPDRDGKMEVEVLPGQVPDGYKWPREQSVTALQAPDVTTEVQIAEFISSTDFSNWPLISSLILQQNAAVGCLEGTGALAEQNPAAAADVDVTCASPDRGSSSDCDTDQAVGTAAADAPELDGGSNDTDSDDDFVDVPTGKVTKLKQQQTKQQEHARSAKVRRLSDSPSNAAFDSWTDDEPEQQLAESRSHPAAAAATTTDDASLQTKADALLKAVVERFNLNDAQERVAAHIADWLPQLMSQQQQHSGGQAMRGPAATVGLKRPKVSAPHLQRQQQQQGTAASDLAGGSSSSSTKPPVCLIHGPFGSGKSTLLVALIHLLTGLVPGASEAAAAGPATSGKKRQAAAGAAVRCPRILVAAHTNVAVDRVLLSLLDSGFTNLLRVGSLQRIARRLLSHSLHSSDGGSRDALSELQLMLQDAAGAEAEMIRSEIAQVQAGAERQRRKRLSTSAVVGVTCCAALQATLEGQMFDIVLLDESSQMTEPTSLVPLLRAKPRFLIAAGDPCQLPPVLTSPTGVTAVTSSSNGSSSRGSAMQQQQQLQGGIVYGLLRPLFVRLTHLGHKEHLLTHQYRCHPTLSMLSNKHFYNNLLVNGVTEQQRSPLIPGLGPLVFCDCQGGRSQSAEGAGRSSVNKAEAQLVVQLVTALLQCRAAQQHQRQQQQLESDTDSQGEQTNGSMNDDVVDVAAVPAHQLGVICFFRGQATLIRQMLNSESSSCPGASDVQVATVDSFQGAEKDVIVLATTTTNPRSEFCSDGARLNVALTRAKRHLIVVGASDVLSQAPGPVLRDLVQSCRRCVGGSSFIQGSNLLQLPALADARYRAA